MTPREILVNNERTKLVANALDRSSTAMLVVGVFGPIGAATFNPGSGPDLTLPTAWIFTILWLVGAVWIHILARRVLKHLM